MTRAAPQFTAFAALCMAFAPALAQDASAESAAAARVRAEVAQPISMRGTGSAPQSPARAPSAIAQRAMGMGIPATIDIPKAMAAAGSQEGPAAPAAGMNTSEAAAMEAMRGKIAELKARREQAFSAPRALPAAQPVRIPGFNPAKP